MNKPYKSCNYCRAYNGEICILGYNIEKLPVNKMEWSYDNTEHKQVDFIIEHKPTEKCCRPKTIKEFCIAVENKFKKEKDK